MLPKDRSRDDIIPFEEPPNAPEISSKHEAITFSRLLQNGHSPGCGACEKGIGNHTVSCRERFDKLIRGASLHFPRALPKALIRGSLKKISSLDFITSSAKSSSLPEDLPVKSKRLGKRTTIVKYFDSGTEDTIVDVNWKGNSKTLKEFWAGQTVFELLPEADEVPGGAIDALSGEQQAKPKPRPTQERKKFKQMVKACVWCICRVLLRSPIPSWESVGIRRG